MTEKNITITKNDEKLQLSESGVYIVNLVKPGAQVEIAGAFAVAGSEKIEVTVIIHHKAPHTRANTTLRGVANDQAHVRFVGRIKIDENCGDTNSFLTERILLLSDDAKAEAVPDLEIKSDDVKCSHAASISRIPEEHIFYLMSRGVTRQAAESLIVEGFLKV
ncbi:MAG TPA: SufD family Fe-S cluster assembly protein [Vitreimonas sp.]|nr:SufD family Fe-S cluster assembly protein [Vitreimonas sp.]